MHTGPWALAWFHRLHKLGSLLRHHRDIHLEISILEGSPSPRSLSTSLPTTLPASVFRFTDVTIDQWQFATVGGFLRLIRELPFMESFAGYRLRFKNRAIPFADSLRHYRYRRSKLSSVVLDRCGTPAFETRLMFLLLSSVAYRHLALNRNSWHAVAEVITNFSTEHRTYEISCLKIPGMQDLPSSLI